MNEKATIAAYKQYMFQFVKLMGSQFSDAEIKSQVEAVYELEKQFALVKTKITLNTTI